MVNRVVVLIIAAVSLFFTAGDLILPFHPFSSLGYDAAASGRITYIYAGMSAQAAGMRAGDRVDVTRLPPAERRYLSQLSLAPAGTQVRLPLIRDGRHFDVTVVAQPRQRTFADNITDIAVVLAQCTFIVIGAWLTWLRPSLLTWTFFLYALGAGNNATVPNQYLPYDLMIPYGTYQNVFAILGPFAMIVFAMIFPRTEATGFARRALPVIAAVPLATIVIDALAGYFVVFSWAARGDAATIDRVQLFNVIVPTAAYVVAVAAFLMNYTRSDEPARKRLQWVALGFIAGFGGLEWLFVQQIAPGISVTPTLWILNLVQTFNIFVPLAVAYAIMKHRVIDVRFFISRALVYGAITTIAVAILAILDWAVAKRLEETKLGLLVEIGGALVIGIGIHRMHFMIDRFVDRFVFRSVHAAETHLESIGEAMMYAHSIECIDEMLRDESARALDLDVVEIVRDPHSDDQLAMRLHAARAPIEEADTLAIPLLVRDRLFGYARFGHHRNGAAIDPNEREILRRLCGRAAVAYDHVTNEEHAQEVIRLQSALAILQAKYDEVRSIVRST